VGNFHFSKKGLISRIEKQQKRITSEKPISLHGVDFKELVRAFLKVKPEDKKPKKKLAK